MSPKFGFLHSKLSPLFNGASNIKRGRARPQCREQRRGRDTPCPRSGCTASRHLQSGSGLGSAGSTLISFHITQQTGAKFSIPPSGKGSEFPFSFRASHPAQGIGHPCSFWKHPCRASLTGAGFLLCKLEKLSSLTLNSLIRQDPATTASNLLSPQGAAQRNQGSLEEKWLNPGLGSLRRQQEATGVLS